MPTQPDTLDYQDFRFGPAADPLPGGQQQLALDLADYRFGPAFDAAPLTPTPSPNNVPVSKAKRPPLGQNYLTVADLLDQGTLFFATLGSFWTGYYGGSTEIRDYTRALQAEDLQTRQNTFETINTISRLSLPLAHRQLWYPYIIRQSQRLNNENLQYTSKDALGAAAVTTLNARTFDYTSPDRLQASALIASAIIDPILLWVQDVEYSVNVTSGYFSFVQDPFSILPGTPVYDDTNTIVDYELQLWLGQADFDYSWLATQFGYTAKFILPSEDSYQTVFNAIWDSDLAGTTRSELDQALSGLCDAPLVQTNGEVVQAIVSEPEQLVIATDQRVYILGATATPIVTIGQVMRAGDRLCDAFTVIDLSQGTPAPNVLPSFTLPLSYLKGSFTGGLTFGNTSVPLIVTTVSGRTKVTFALGGNPADVTLFWNTVHTNGIVGGHRTLAQLLDLRPQPQSTDPDANSLPTSINPLDFLIKNVLRYGSVLLAFNSTSFGINALLAPAPVAPLNLAAGALASGIFLAWTLSDDATSYNLYRGTVSGGESLYQTGVLSGYLDTNVTLGTTYYYKVTAVNESGESGPSNEATAVVSVGLLPNIWGWWQKNVGVYDDLGVTPATIGGPVGQWSDQTGQGHHYTQVLGVNRPLAFGDLGLYFDGPHALAYMNGTSLTGFGAISVFIVFNTFTFASHFGVVWSGSSSSHWTLMPNTGGGGAEYAMGSSPVTGADELGSHVLVATKAAGGTLNVYLDGVFLGTMTDDATLPSIHTLGNYSGNISANQFYGFIKEAAIIARVVTVGEIAALSAYGATL